MWKKIESFILHFVIVFVRRGFRFLLRRCGIVLDDDNIAYWYNERCGLEECIYDDGIIELFCLRSHEVIRRSLEEYEKPFCSNP